MLAFGWFMHAIFELHYGFPFHRNLRPIFLSFHCNKRDLLTPDALAYLRACGPIGCRDWTTVDILLSVGVPAFFSGCMTTTVSNVFPDLAERPGPRAPVAYVDVPPELVPRRGVVYKHSSDAVRLRSFATNVYDAMELLETYRRKHSAMVTSRLHAWLPEPVDRGQGRLPAEEPLGHPLRRADRHYRGRVRRDPRRHQQQARKSDDSDPLGRETRRRVRAVARDDRGRGRRRRATARGHRFTSGRRHRRCRRRRAGRRQDDDPSGRSLGGWRRRTHRVACSGRPAARPERAARVADGEHVASDARLGPVAHPRVGSISTSWPRTSRRSRSLSCRRAVSAPRCAVVTAARWCRATSTCWC